MASSIIQPTDGELLFRFNENGDEGAFRELVERHAPLVHTVCRRVLHSEPDVEDAFQATFLVLARDAKSIRCRDSVSSWLFKVAHRTAIRAVMDRQRRNEHPLQDDVVIPSETLEQIQDREDFELLAAELHRLPENYRNALILFYLEGKSRSAAAEELDCTDATLKAHLARGRRLLRQRLMRRGVAMSLVLTAAAVSTQAAEAALQSNLIGQTVSAGLQLAATGKAGAACSAKAITLAEGVRPMASAVLTKSTIAVGIVLTAGLLTAIGIGTGQLAAQPKADGKQSAKAADAEGDVLDSRIKTADKQQPAETPLTLAQAAADASKQPASAATPRRKTRTSAKQRIEAALAQSTELEFIDTPLKDAMDFLADYHEITIILDESALTEEGIATDEPITLSLKGVSLRNALNLILKPLGLRHFIEDEVLKITAAGPPAALDLKKLSEAERKIEASLEKPTEMEFIDTPLKDAMAFLADFHEITIILDESALTEEGIATDEPINQVLKGISLQSALNIMLKPLALTYLIEDEVMKITTTTVEESRKETRVYAVKKLVSAGIEVETLKKVIEQQDDTVVETLPGLLVVTQSQSGHRKTIDLLQQLHRAEIVQP